MPERLRELERLADALEAALRRGDGELARDLAEARGTALTAFVVALESAPPADRENLRDAVAALRRRDEALRAGGAQALADLSRRRDGLRQRTRRRAAPAREPLCLDRKA